ncbi:MAG: hypothetical protein PHZ09_04425 [Eubacteriales bacterium]|jgi:hypothetical protein|nr:hypothetical protein [Eubacteriales bacterium]
MSSFIPFPAYYDDAPIDLSFVYKNEKPAGRRGFLKAEGGTFVFEDGTPGRFWGTNFNGGANFPEFDYAEKVARRLGKIGVNIVRFHQLDAEWDTPNLFSFSNGKRCDKTTELDSESMKRLDYLIHCLKEEGIYVYIDIFTYRKFKTGDGVENAPALADAGKPYSGYNKRLIELQKKLAYDIWNHYNPYTGLRYKDDPVFVMCEVVNESDLFSRKIATEPYLSEFRELFNGWLAEKGIEYDACSCDVNGTDEPLIQFKIELQERYYTEMIGFMRDIGVKIPLTGTNWSINKACSKTQLVTDFTDSHVYYYDWRWGEYKKSCMNKAITESPDCGFGRLSIMRVADKPFFVSEWDMPWPNEYRAESPLLFAAVGSFQGWSGFTIHTYAYTSRLMHMNILGKEVSSDTIGGVPYREGIFSTWNDPAKFGLFYHAALITRRGDVPVSENLTMIDTTDLSGGTGQSFNSSPEQNRIACNYLNKGEGVDENIPLVNPDSGEVMSDNGCLYRSWHKRFGYIDTERTKCAYGFLAENGTVRLKDMTFDCKTDFAVLALSSLTDVPLGETDNILFTAVGRAKNTDAVFEGEVMKEYGKPPVLIEVIEAEIAFGTSQKNLVCRAVNAEGFYIGTVPSWYDSNGMFHVKTGETMRSMYYLIAAE